jgi:gliding motility-associated-like protein
MKKPFVRALACLLLTLHGLNGRAGAAHTLDLRTERTPDAPLAPPALVVQVTSVANVTCHGLANGAVGITVSGGTAPYSFAWNNGAVTEDISALTAGSYTVIVTDADGSTASASGTVQEPAPMNATATSSGNILCPATTATITVTASGGVAPLSGTGTFTVGAGTYGYTVTDANGCTAATNSITVQFFPVSNMNTGVGYSDIQQAVNAASPGHTIDVCAGTYTLPAGGTILVNKALTLRGANQQVDPTETPSVRGPESRIVVSHSSGRAMTITASDVRVDGFEFEVRGSRDGINVITPLVPGGAATLSNLNISNNIFRSTTTTASQKNAILFGESSVPGNPGATLDTAHTRNVIIDRNLFEFSGFANTARGLVFTTHFDWHAYADITITGNRFNMAMVNGQGIVASAVPARHQIANMVVSDNDFSGYLGIDLTKAVTPTIENNRFAGLGYIGMGLGSSSGGTVRGNTIDGTNTAMQFGSLFYGIGIWLYGGSNFGSPTNGATGNNAGLVIENNDILNFTHPTETNATFRGITSSANAGPGLLIQNNNIHNVHNGVLFASSTANEQTVEHNSFTGNRKAIWCSGGSLINANCNWYGSVIADTIATKLIGNIDHDPWLTVGTDTDPAIGFQPVNGACATLAPLELSAVANDAGCAGKNNGAVDATVTGGLAPYTFTWSNGENTEDISGVPAGTYIVTVTDALGSTATATAIVTEPSPLEATGDAQDVLCNSGTTGSIDISVTGGTAPATFAWNNGANTEDLTDLPAGSYSVTVTDANGCIATATFELDQPALLEASGVQQDLLCAGAASGSINVSLTGGTAPATFAWNNGATTEDLTDLPAGSYSVTVTDANGCIATGAFTLSEPAPLQATADITSATCQGSNTGAIDLSITGGTQPYAQAWSGPNGYTSANEDISALSAGVYTVTITDANGCTSQASFDATEPGLFSIDATLSTYAGGYNVSCAGKADGSITTVVTGGVPELTFQWNGPGGFTAATANISGLLAGTYDLIVTDQNGCSALATYVLQEPTELYAELEMGTYAGGTNTSCHGSTDGSIDATIQGGDAPYTLAWIGPNGPIANTEDIAGLGAGEHILLMTDAIGCTASASITLVEPAPLNASATSPSLAGVHNTSCADANDGSIDLDIQGGTTPYDVAWSGPDGLTSSTVDISGLAAGTYTAAITDANGCSTTATITLTAPGALSIGLQASAYGAGHAVPCHGDASGTITADVTGGTPGFAYLWTGPDGLTSTSTTLTGATAGTYTLQVTDTNGCANAASIELTEPDALFAEAVAVDNGTGYAVGCAGNDGAITLSVGGGVMPLQYAWTGPNGYSAPMEDIDALGAGMYVITVTDANGCTVRDSVLLQAPDPMTASTEVGGNLCAGVVDGSISLQVSGGAGALSFSWTGPDGFAANSQDVTSLGAGTYVVTITDMAGCTATTSATIEQPTAIAFSVLGLEHNTCAGVSTGAVTMGITGGTAPLGATWNGPDGFSSTDTELTGLAAGTYVLSVVDANGCARDTSITINGPASPLELDLTATLQPGGTNISCFGGADGSIDATIGGGTTPYTFAWQGPDGSAFITEDINGLAEGTYTLVVTDANQCTQVATIALSGPDAPLEAQFSLSQYNGWNVSCANGTDGTINVTILGGGAISNIDWTGPGGFTASGDALSGLEPGTYVMSGSDVNGCPVNGSVLLTGPDPIVPALDAATFAGGVNISCFGGTDGSIDATIGGGTAPYTFAWEGPDGNTFTTEDIGGLAAGTYTLAVTDANQCTQVATIALSGPDAPLEAQFSLSQYNGWNVSCANGTDGTINVTILGGGAISSIDWTGPGGFTASGDVLTGLEPGTYVMSGSDVNGCPVNGSVLLTAPEPIATTLDAATFAGGTNISCFGMSDGSITTSINGGAGDMTASWTGPNGFAATTAAITGLQPGTYCITITDGNGCQVNDCINLTEPAAVSASAIASPMACGANGAIDATVNGGSQPYTYAWSNGSSQEDQAGLVAGTYTLTVTDANGCTTSTTAEVTGSQALAISATTTDVTCHGGNNGSIDLSVQGGMAPYTFAWTGQSQTEDLTDLMAGAYQVTVTDVNGCTWSGIHVIDEPEALAAQGTVSDHGDDHEVSAIGATDGQIALQVTGGTPPYAYAWSNGATTDVVTGLAAGTMAVTITDANGCSIELQFELSGPTAIEMPTGFTPNGDGQNEAFVVRGIDGLTDVRLIVFNRWGNVVFDRLNYRNDWRGENMEGEALPNGTYFVILRPGSNAENLQGYVDLRR